MFLSIVGGFSSSAGSSSSTTQLGETSCRRLSTSSAFSAGTQPVIMNAALVPASSVPARSRSRSSDITSYSTLSRWSWSHIERA